MPLMLMMRTLYLTRRTLLTLGLTLLLPMTALASVGKIVIAQGDVFAVNANNEQRSLARQSDINEGDTLVTGANGSLQIRFNDNAVLALSQDSRLRISEYHGRDAGNDEEQVLMDLLAGGFRTITGSIGSSDRDAYQVRTPNASIGIRGTHYEALLEQASLLLGVYDGGIVVSNANGTLNLGIGGDFLFGQVGAGTAPQGLLEPPARLNQPLVPGTGQTGQPQPDDEPESQLSGEEEGIPLNLAFGGDEPPPRIPEFTEEQTETFLAFLSELEDGLEDFAEEADLLEQSTDVRLTAEQVAALADDPGKGFIVLTDSDGDAVHFGYWVEGTNGPVFINYDSESLTELDDGFVTPDRVYKGPALTDPINQVTLEREDQTVEWGIWNASPTDPATLLESNVNLADATLDATHYFYVLAEPADLTDLTGIRNLSMCTTPDCFSYTASSGEQTYLMEGGGNMEVDLTNLNAGGDIYLSMSDGNTWNIYFTGDINDSLLSTDNLTYFYELDGLSESVLWNDQGPYEDITGEVQGLFINGEDQSIDFVGGFGVSSDTADQSISGVFLMSGEEDLPN